MITGRRATDWLPAANRPTVEQADGETRRGFDRRAGDRRAPRRKIDTLFAASLINQLAPATEPCSARAYRPIAPHVRAGILTDARA